MGKNKQIKKEMKGVIQDARSNVNESSRRKRLIIFGKLFILIIVLVLLPIIAYYFAKDTLFNQDWMNNLPRMIEDNKWQNFLYIIAVQIIQVVICIIPGQPIQIASSYMYGVLIGFILSIIGVAIGTALTYYIAKVLGKDAMHLLFGQERVQQYHSKLNSRKSLLIVFIIYLIPGLPKDLVSYVAGISEIDFKQYLIVSTIGRSPGILGSLIMGAFIGKGQYLALGIFAAVVIVILIVCYLLRNKIFALIDHLEDEMNKKKEKRHKD